MRFAWIIISSLLQAQGIKEQDYQKAKEVLATTPDDPEANTVVGKRLAFVEGDYNAGLVCLSKSSNTVLKTLAEHERAPLYADTAVKKVGMADEWVAAAKSFPMFLRPFYDRASTHYAAAWPDLDPVWREKVRERGMKLAASRPPGAERKGLPNGWIGEQLVPGAKAPLLDGTIAHTGSYSIKLLPADEKVPNSLSRLKSDLLVIPPGSKELEYSAWVLTNGTDNAGDRLEIHFPNIVARETYVTPDLPLWVRVSGKTDIPGGAQRCIFGAALISKKGTMWVSGISVKIDGKEAIKNGTFDAK